jgi:cystathionine gamma-synthase
LRGGLDALGTTEFHCDGKPFPSIPAQFPWGIETMKDMKDLSMGSACVWAGEARDPSHGATQMPVVHSVSFGYDDFDSWLDVAQGRAEGYIYGRNTNPTVQVFEEKLRLLEGAEAATSFATGMAAVSNTLFTLLSPGERVVSIKDSYGGTSKVFLDVLPRFGVEATLCDTTDHDALETEIARGCRVVYLESPTNPTLKVVDIERLARAAHAAGALVIVDNTFATPINQSPLELGADLVLHSATKYLGGHADALGGGLCGPRELVERVYHFREITGASLGPMAAYLLLRGMKTLHLRVRQQSQSALRVARFLESHAAVSAVHYPGLESHPGHAAALRPSRSCCPACASPTAPRISAPSRPSSAPRPRRATWSAAPRSGRSSASPRHWCVTRLAWRRPRISSRTSHRRWRERGPSRPLIEECAGWSASFAARIRLLYRGLRRNQIA